MSEAGGSIYIGFSGKGDGSIVKMTREKKIAEMRGFGLSDEKIRESIDTDDGDAGMTGDLAARVEGMGKLPVADWRGPIYGNAQSDAAEAHEANIVAEDLVRINDSGIVPTEFKVLVLPDMGEAELRLKRSGLAVPDAYAAMYAHGTVTGTIVAMSPAAFSYHDWPEGCRIPLVGERIVFARYAGMLVAGKPVINERGHEEPREYRLLNDKDIAAVLEF